MITVKQTNKQLEWNVSGEHISAVARMSTLIQSGPIQYQTPKPCIIQYLKPPVPAYP